MATGDISRFILKQQGLVIPEIILSQEFIAELDEELHKQSPLLVSHFLKKVANNIDNYIDTTRINNVNKRVAEMEEGISATYGSLLTNDDLEILKLLHQVGGDSLYDFLEIAGPLYFSLEIIDDLNSHKEIYSEKIKLSSSFWLFDVLFEQILHMIDRRLINFLNDPNNPKAHDSYYNRFKNLERKQYHNQATAGSINYVLSKILSLDPKKNLSIFGHIDNPANLRNRISHSNLFFDSRRNKIVCLDGSEYEIEDFVKEFMKLLQFLFEWIRLTVNRPLTDPQISKDVSKDLLSSMNIMSNLYRREHRFYRNRRLASLILWIEEESTSNT
jgi:hypothetical protein